MYEKMVAWLRSWSELPAHCECYESCDECDKQDLCATFTNESIITKAGEAADAIEELNCNYQLALGSMKKEYKRANEAEKQKPRWIPVTERLPSENNRYLTVSIEPWFGTTVVDTMRWSGVWMLDGRQTEATVTHWMPLPQPPKEET